MRLIKPSPGELADRQTILEIKIEHVDREVVDKEPDLRQKGPVVRTVVMGDTKVQVHHFFYELELIQNHLKQDWIPDILNKPGMVEKYDELYDELTDINSALWDLQDEARILRNAPDKFKEAACKRAAEVLFAIDTANEKRAELVKSINELWGLEHQEKVYA